MAKKKGNIFGKTVAYESKAKFKKTSISKRRPKFSSMNKSKKRSFKAYNRGGRWIKDQASIPMESLFHIKCHRILDHHKVEVVVGTADYIQINMASAEYGELEESKILMFVINGDKDILKDNV